ncbi:uncharacterized protein LTR77_006279 [Saxophila tyrrhenica]|uniref:Adenylyltransferase and sulfurtransferase uba4 n=1 Tax=Saxophila tyrrhenica TaxID=1690608 RepID=A0AAV9PBP8_9PEZI|nr:hypothetical protein LTR77_006279 [Saxophila tyrrhenica]
MPSSEDQKAERDDRFRANKLCQIEIAEASLRDLKKELEDFDSAVSASGPDETADHTDAFPLVPDAEAKTDSQSSEWPLSSTEYQRYGRQMIMPEIGLRGQLQLKKAKVLIVGVGGLGCPAAAYLAGAGVGTLGLMDGDTVEVSNLHRQVAHATGRVGMSKVDSAYEYLYALNPEVNYIRHSFHLSPEHAISVFEQYDIVLDCTDHPTSRYLISDTSVLTSKPLVSASALKTEGQLIVLNDPPKPPGDLFGGPCYRCIFPKPPPAESVLSCGEGGILGPVVGVMGVLQALEAIKVLTRRSEAQGRMTDAEPATAQPVKASLLIFSAFSSPQFRTIKMRSRRADCAACSAKRVVTADSLSSGSLDYIAFCGRTTPVDVLDAQSRLSAKDFAQLPRDDQRVLVDVRDEVQYSICALPGSINVPWTGNADSWLSKAQDKGVMEDDQKEKYIVCRFGNDSQLAAKAMQQQHKDFPGITKDIRNGFQAWRKDVDPSWPDY